MTYPGEPRMPISIRFPWRRLIYPVAIFGAILLFLTFSSVAKTPIAHIGLSYGGGPFEGARWQFTKPPGSGLFFNGILDKLYLYPSTQRNYIISKSSIEGERGQVDFIPAPSGDSVEVDFEVAVYFKLNLDKVVKFHEQIGVKYQAWTDEGWDRMLNDSFRQQIESAIQEEARQYPVEAIYSDPGVLLNIQTEVTRILQDRITKILGDEYFCGPTYIPGGECPRFSFVIKRVTLPANVVASFQAIKVSENQISVKQNEVLQAELQAKAIEALNEALRTAESADAYVLLKAIESGRITFWVVPTGTNLTLATPTPG